jgi:hypothetical protein
LEVVGVNLVENIAAHRTRSSGKRTRAVLDAWREGVWNGARLLPF